MHKTFPKLLGIALTALMGIAPFAGLTQATGPSSSQSSYLLPVTSGVTFTSILTANDSINHYKMAGIPDGLGAYDNGDGTFTLLVNHEIPNSAGAVRAHGSTGAFVSKWIINKQDLSVVSGSDLIQNVYLWDNTTSGYTLYNAANPSTLAVFQRFCSADLPPVSAFHNSNSGNGTQERIYMNGEEVSDGRAIAHIVTGPNAGTSWQLPWFGKLSWENSVANPTAQDKTIVGLLDDGSTTTSNVYFYIGSKTNVGTDIDKAGLNNGSVYAVKISGYPQERVSSTVINDPPVPGTHFDLVNVGSVLGLTGAQVDANSLAAGATYFSRTEDGAWNPSNLSDFYFNTTDQIDQVNDGVGTQVGRSRLWHLHFTDITNPELGGTIEAVLDGTEGQVMFDNLAVDRSGHIQELEDVGNSAHNGKIWDYNTATDVLTMIGKHDPARFGDIGLAATAPFNQDEETSGVIDVQSLLGPGMFLVDDQAHYSTGIPVEVFEGGQLLAYYNPLTSNCDDFSATITPAGSATYCKGSEVTLRTNAGYGFTYQWYRGNATIIGATNATYSPVSSGKYYVVESNGTCSWTSPLTNIKIVASPIASITAVQGLDLCATGTVTLRAAGGSGASSFAWYKDNSSLGATTKKIVVSQTGSYSVRITNHSGCSSTSAPVSVIKSCKFGDQPISTAVTMNLYPNPSNGNFVVQLKLTDDFTGTADIQIINTLGQVVFKNTTLINSGIMQQEMNLANTLPQGNYYLRVIADGKLYVKQMVIQP